MNTPAMNTPDTTPLGEPLDNQRAEDLHWAVGLVEDWLLHASPETLDELADFAHGPAPRGHAPVRWIIDRLGEAALRLRPAPTPATPQVTAEPATLTPGPGR
jgi:hypothetical protein